MVRSPILKLRETVSTHTILAIFALIAILPVAYTLSTSLKPKIEVRTNPPLFFPQVWTIQPYQQVLNSNLVKYHIPNSLINSFASSILTVAIAALASYAFSRYKFRGSRALQLAILGLMMIPGLTNLIPLYKIASDTGLLRSSPHLMMVLVYTAGGLPFTIWIIKSFFDAIPIEIEEAALIDGCSPLQALRHVVAPLAAPGLLAGFLLMFVDTWNEFLAAVLLLNNERDKVATVGLYAFQTSFEIEYNVWMAGCIVIMIPVIVLFIALRRTFFEAMLQGALKG
jgi:ABC-type glycerol-3-phosphate transport system permease component